MAFNSSHVKNSAFKWDGNVIMNEWLIVSISRAAQCELKIVDHSALLGISYHILPNELSLNR